MSAALTAANHYAAVVAKTKRLLLRSDAGANGIRRLSRTFGIADDCGGSSTTTKESFIAALAACHVECSEKDVAAVFTVLDRDGSGTIDPADFVAAMRCDMSPLRRCWLTRAWLSFEQKDACGCVPIADLRAAYRAERHPDVVRGSRSVAEVEEEFAATFNESTNPEGVVSQQEFDEYYSGVSGLHCDDEGFTALLRAVWPMPGVNDAFTSSLVAGKDVINRTFSAHQTATEKKAISLVKNMQAEMMRVITQEHRPKVMESGLAMRLLSLSLRSSCAAAGLGSGSGLFLHTEDFAAALRQCRLYVANAEAVASLDTNGDGTVDVLYYLSLLLPPLAPARRLMLERLWQRVFANKDAAYRVDVKQFHSRYVAKDGEGRNAFLSAWDVRTAVEGKVSLDELVEWYGPISAKVQLDKDFEALLGREWKGFAQHEETTAV